MTYIELFERVRAEQGLNVDKTIKLFAEVLERSPETIKSYPTKGCPNLALKVLINHFR